MSRNLGQQRIAGGLAAGARGVDLTLSGTLSGAAALFTGRVGLPDGTLGAPSLYFANYEAGGGGDGLFHDGTFVKTVKDGAFAFGAGSNGQSLFNGLLSAVSIYLTTNLYLASNVSTLANAAATIGAFARNELNNTSGGALTLTSAPTMADGVVDGQLAIIVNKSANNVTIQDQGTLANSNLRLAAATIVLGTRDGLIVAWSTALGDWCQITPVSNVL